MSELDERERSGAAIRERTREVRRRVRAQTFTYLGAALGLVAGLAWNDAITSLIAQVFPVTRDTIIAKFVYAVVITIAVVALSLWFIKLIGTADDAGTK